MKNIKLLIEYDGTNYSGWQKQINNNVSTIQGTIEQCLSKVTGEKVEVIGCSRTDAGVHAKGFVANFITESRIPSDKFKYAINRVLPEDIVIIDSKEENINFHARYCCIGKRYIYKILNRQWKSPILRNYAYHFKDKLDVESMNKAAQYLIGKHDFTSFKSSGSSVRSSVRTIMDAKVYAVEDLVIFIISGDGFLYNMVRIIVGTLIEVGIGKKKPEDIVSILEAKDRQKAGASAPARGLYLDEVFY
ncbi:tRNA pseudouridine synthase A [Clostridium liquoris]|jgi:tRNA pseudouridine38-40 synthase|uniref:tRNA pseudouridine synthase A n=1 Tax=Clostridium liquoris TaxID=1289519 RepID=A0A2T0B9J8_9CLOT|nr:tRNA pseudouridine(38-40) synthase TruA [Clostridium liquoris]PRR80522.1 tRNA pseudouridine synthase A [Clostridium liquoris]